MRALIFDLDGTLVDTVYGHVLAWQRVLDEGGFPIEGWKVHRLIGMSGGLLTRAIELLRHLTDTRVKYGIATSGRRKDAKPSLDASNLPEAAVIVDRNDVERASRSRTSFWRLSTSSAYGPRNAT